MREDVGLLMDQGDGVGKEELHALLTTVRDPLALNLDVHPFDEQYLRTG